MLEHGPMAVMYAVCDRVVDEYERVGAALEEDVDEVEESVFSPARTDDSTRIYVLKREIAEVRRAVLPLREPMRKFRALRTVPTMHAIPITAETATYFRDVADHLQRVSEVIDNLDILLSTAFDAHLARISVQQNEDMRKISAGAALVVVPDADRRGLRHELRPHARAALDLRLPVRAGADGRGLRPACSRCSRSPGGCDRPLADGVARGVVVRLRQPGRRHGLRGRPVGLRTAARRARGLGGRRRARHRGRRGRGAGGAAGVRSARGPHRALLDADDRRLRPDRGVRAARSRWRLGSASRAWPSPRR